MSILSKLSTFGSESHKFFKKSPQKAGEIEQTLLSASSIYLGKSSLKIPKVFKISTR